MSKRDEKRSRRLRRNGFIEITNALLTLVIIGLVLVGGTLGWGAYQFYEKGPVAEPTTFLVEPNNGLSTVARRLEEAGLIRSSVIPATMLFQGMSSYVLRKSGSIRAGEYTIAANASMGDILETITEGKPNDYFVMVNPGDTSWAVAAKLNDPAQNLLGDPVAVPAEGSILPIRHDYFPRDTREKVLAAMQAQMTEAVDAAWASCRADVCGPEGVLKSKQELVILASLVEEETGLAEERPIVAGLFINRLKRGMRLETDPTILYGLFKGEDIANRTITLSQKNSDTPYNTYFINGLPPTPISNPGRDALQAVAQPAQTDYLYMMAVTPGDYTDGHAFAATLAEHNQNVTRYRRLEDQQQEQAQQPAATPQ